MAIIGALPVTLTNGTIADATQVMADFNYILSQVNANAAPVTGGAYLALTGGTLTGVLNIAPAANALVTLNKATAVNQNVIIGQTGGLTRWQIIPGNSTGEGGSNSGSDFGISRFADSGTIIDTPLAISRATGAVTIPNLVSPSAASLRNFLINPLFNVQQRSVQNALSMAVAASTSPYTFDRWYLQTGANQAHVVSASAPLFGNVSGPYGAVITRTAGQTGVTSLFFGQPFDTDLIQLLAGQQVTIAATLAGNAGFSAANVSLQLIAGTGAPTRTATGFTSPTTVCNVTQNVPTSGTPVNFLATGTIPANTRQLELRVLWTPVGTAPANDGFNIFVPRLMLGGFDIGADLTRIYTTELPICQRFYAKSFDATVAPVQNSGSTSSALWVRSVAAATFGQVISFNGTAGMRIAPSVTTYNPSVANANWRDIVGAVDRTVQLQTAGTKSVQIEGLAGTIGGANLIHWTADAEIL